MARLSYSGKMWGRARSGPDNTSSILLIYPVLNVVLRGPLILREVKCLVIYGPVCPFP